MRRSFAGLLRSIESHRNRVLLAVAGLCVAAPETMAAAPDAEPPPPAGYRLDWYAWAEVAARPYMTLLHDLCDGDLGTGSHYEGGPEVGGTLVFTFPSPVEVNAFRFVQGTCGASRFRLSADADGDGTFETPVQTEEMPKVVAGEWITTQVGRKVRGLEFVALAGTAGFRAPFPQFQEIEIYTAKPVPLRAPQGVTAKHTLSVGAAVALPAFTVRTIENIVCTDFWHAGLLPTGANLPADLNQFPPFRAMVERLKAVDATAVRVFSENAGCDNRLPWPTELGPHTERNLLKAYVDALHKEGFRTYYFTHAWISPFQKADRMAPFPYRRWDYPYEQSDRLIYREDLKQYYTEKYPCITGESDFRDKWFRLLSEAVAQGVDGVYLMPDEYYFKGHHLPKTDCPACRRQFQARFGYDALPAKPADTEAYRKWELFEYEAIHDLFSAVARGLKAAKPDLTVFSNGNQAAVQLCNTRLEHGMALDIQGRDLTVDAGHAYGGETLDLGSHTAFSRRYRGAFGDRRLLASLQWLNISYQQPPDPIRLHGYLLPFIMEGARYADSYRLNYMHDFEGWWPIAIAGFRRMRLLEQWGIGQSRTPASVCVLLSRASEDWWQVRTEGLLGQDAVDTTRSTVLYSQDEALGAALRADTPTRTRELNCERFRGMAAGKCLEGLLIEAGIAYDLRYSDRPETLTNLRNYRLLVLPFSYSMSCETFNAVKAAVETGAKLLIVDQLAPTDEYGSPYPAPLLEALRTKPHVVFEKLNLARDGMRRSVRTRLTERLRQLTGDTGIRFDANGARVEFLLRELTDGSRILYLANWEHRPVAPVVGLDLPPGRYRLTLCPGAGVDLAEGLVDGKADPDASALRRFSVPLSPREVVLAHVVPRTAAR